MLPNTACFHVFSGIYFKQYDCSNELLHVIKFLCLLYLLCHADCIGSAFNIKGAMQCPNCRQIEKGQWLYANGCRSYPEFNIDEWTHDEDLYDLSYSEMVKSC